MNRFSKDVDTIDNTLGDAMRMFVATLGNILGAVILIAIVLPWFLIAVGVVGVAYVWAAMFYRASARELKRLGTSVVHFTVRSRCVLTEVGVRCAPAVVAVQSLLGVALWAGDYSCIRRDGQVLGGEPQTCGH